MSRWQGGHGQNVCVRVVLQVERTSLYRNVNPSPFAKIFTKNMCLSCWNVLMAAIKLSVICRQLLTSLRQMGLQPHITGVTWRKFSLWRKIKTVKGFTWGIRLQGKPINLNSCRPKHFFIANVRIWVLSRWWEVREAGWGGPGRNPREVLTKAERQAWILKWESSFSSQFFRETRISGYNW